MSSAFARRLTFRLLRRPGRPGRPATVALAACLLIVAACGGSGGGSGTAAGGGTSGTVQPLAPCPLDALASATQPVEVVLWHPFVAKTKDTLEAMVAQYNASQTKVKVRVEAQGSYNELAAKYRAAVPSKDLPAIAIFEDINTKSVADSGTILPAQSCIDADRYDTSDLLASVKAFYSVGGALFPASANISTPLLYVNRSQFRKAGLDPDKAPTTLAEIRADAEKLKAAGVVDKPLALSLQPWFIESWLNGEGAPIVNNDNGRGPGQTTGQAFDNDQAREIYTWIRDMNRDGLLTAVPNTDGNIDDYLAMAQQKTSMIIESSVAATSIKAFLKGDLDPSTLQGGGGAAPSDPNALDIGAALFPGVSEPGKVRLGGSGWYLTNTTKPEVQAAAWDFMKWWNETDQQIRWNLEGSYLPFRTSAAKDPRVTADWTSDISGRWLAISYSQLVNGINPDFPGAQFGPFDKYTSATSSSIESMIFGGTDPAAAVTDAATKTTDAITQYNKDNF
jgi:sn-glycerol 3-phosphate transport system substrate-binding protein